MVDKKSLGSELYDDAASFGRVYIMIAAVVGTLFALMFIIGGIYIIYHKSHLKSVIGTVTEDSLCTRLDKRSESCANHYTYTVEGKQYTGSSTSSTEYKKGDKITVWYDPNHPDVDSEMDIPTKTIGWIAIFIGIFFIIIAWLSVYLTRNYKFAAAAGGIGGGIDIIKQINNNIKTSL